MAIFEEKMYGLQCDNCGEICDDGDGHNVWPEKSQALANAQEWNNWIEHEGKYYCPKCYEIDDNDCIIIKAKKNKKTETSNHLAGVSNSQKGTKRVIYFGTNGCPGHTALPITGEFSDEEIKEVESIDDHIFYRIFTKKEFKIAKFKNYTILGFPASPDDHRGGSKTVVMIEGEATEVDFIVLLNSVSFLNRQFTKLADMFKINIWKE